MEYLISHVETRLRQTGVSKDLVHGMGTYLSSPGFRVFADP